METWDLISKVVNYIEENVENKITMEELAKIACLSPFYFQRIFKRLVNATVMEYIKFRRLAKISEELKQGSNNNILDICLRYGFENPETFSRNFKEAYGMTPSEYKANPIILSHFNKPNLSLQYNIIDEDVPILTDGIVLEVTRLSLDKPKYFAGYIATGELNMQTGELKSPSVNSLEEVWKKLHQTKTSMKGYMPEGNEIGINLNLAKRTKEIKYFAGAQTSQEVQDEQLEKYTLVDKKYIVCKVEAEDFNTLITDTIGKVYKYMYLWVRNKKAKVESVAIELYYGSSPDSSYMELWIPLKEE